MGTRILLTLLFSIEYETGLTLDKHKFNRSYSGYIEISKND